MIIEWSASSRADLTRLYDFLAPVNKLAAARILQALTAAPLVLLENPRIGHLSELFAPLEVRRLLVRDYEIRYEIQESSIYILRVWHTRENR